jgi:methionyl aminopeptidase
MKLLTASAPRLIIITLLGPWVVQVICHGIPDDRELQNGDIVNVDVTAYLNGYHGDLNEVGVVDEEVEL